jgi:hypothetical protein
MKKAGEYFIVSIYPATFIEIKCEIIKLQQKVSE